MNDAYHMPLRETVAEQIERAQELEDGAFAVVDHYHSLGSRFGARRATCPFARFLTIIGADCTVYTCQDKAYTARGVLGSMANRRFRDYWFSEENWAALRAINPSRDCLHHCVAEAKNELLYEYAEIDVCHAPFV